MSRLVDRWEYDDGSYELGDLVWFRLPWGSEPVRGEIVRVYSTRTAYHVEHGGDRYSVSSDEIARNPEDLAQ